MLSDNKRLLSFGIVITFALLLASCGNANSAEVQNTRFADDFKYKTYDSYTEISGYTGVGGNVKIPDKIDSLPVKSIASEAFYSCETLTSITIPQTVETIGEKAFYNCSSLESIAFSDNIAKIGSFAFKNTAWLSEQSDEFVIVGDGVLVDYRGTSQKVVIPEGVTTFEDAFADNYSITSISLPSTLKSMGDGAFYACTIIKEIGIENNSRFTVENNALYNADKTTLIYRPAQAGGDEFIVSDGVTELSPFAFSNNTKLKRVVLPQSLKKIGEYCFDYCTALEEIDIPDKTEALGKYAFNYCSSLKRLTLGKRIEKIPEGAFSSCKNLNHVVIPVNVRIIDKNAFYYCNSLQDIKIPDSTSVDDNAFTGG